MTVLVFFSQPVRVLPLLSVNGWLTTFCNHVIQVHAILGVRATRAIFYGGRADSQDRMDQQETWQVEVNAALRVRINPVIEAPNKQAASQFCWYQPIRLSQTGPHAIEPGTIGPSQ